MSIRSADEEHASPNDRPPQSLRIRSRIALGAVVCLAAASAAIMSSAQGWAAPRSKPTPTPSATPAPTASPSPTPTPSPTPSPTSSPSPSAPPPVTCQTTITAGTVAYCVATFTDIVAGRYPVGTPVAVSGAWVLDVITVSQRSLGRNECPPGMYCGAGLVTLTAEFSVLRTPPAVDSFIDVFGTVTADRGIHVDAYQ